MKRMVLVVVIAGLVLLTVGIIAPAQTGMAQIQKPESCCGMKAGSTVSTGAEQSTEPPSACEELLSDFLVLENHFNNMKEINELPQLRAAMETHSELVIAMHNKITNHLQICRQMMSMMKGPGKIHEHPTADEVNKMQKGHRH